jgi:hypothetical protein
MTHTVESLMALAERYAELHTDYVLYGYDGLDKSQTILESALREALRDEFNRGIDAMAEKYDVLDRAKAILALKEQP